MASTVPNPLEQLSLDQLGSGGAGHVRLNYATSQDVLTEAVRRMGSLSTA